MHSDNTKRFSDYSLNLFVFLPTNGRLVKLLPPATSGTHFKHKSRPKIGRGVSAHSDVIRRAISSL